MAHDYVDFSVSIECAEDGGCLVRGFSSQAEAESATELPFDQEGLNRVLRGLVAGALSTKHGRDLGGGDARPKAPPDFNRLAQALFSALFPAEVGELYAAEWSAALKAGHGLRIRLHLRPGNPRMAWLTRVPWELIFDQRAGVFPCLNPLNPLIRHVDLPRPVEQIPFRSPLRVLVAAANPSGLSKLNLEGERERIEGASRVRVELLAGAGPEDLRRELQRGGYQILHFMGHGLVDSEEGSLAFSASGNRLNLVTGAEMSHLVQGAQGIGLVILNACHSAAPPKSAGADPLAGVAGALVRGGQPAVVGMQFAISDSAALTFSKILYERLAAGDPIEAAVAEARLAVYLANSSSTDWIAPVLFLRGADQRVEGGKVDNKRQENNFVRVNYESELIEGGRTVITGVAEEGSAKRSSTRPVDSRIKVKAGVTKVDELSITGVRKSD